MDDRPVDLTAVTADDALLTRIGASDGTEQFPTELEHLLLEWRKRSRPGPGSP